MRLPAIPVFSEHYRSFYLSRQHLWLCCHRMPPTSHLQASRSEEPCEAASRCQHTATGPSGDPASLWAHLMLAVPVAPLVQLGVAGSIVHVHGVAVRGGVDYHGLPGVHEHGICAQLAQGGRKQHSAPQLPVAHHKVRERLHDHAGCQRPQSGAGQAAREQVQAAGQSSLHAPIV